MLKVELPAAFVRLRSKDRPIKNYKVIKPLVEIIESMAEEIAYLRNANRGSVGEPFMTEEIIAEYYGEETIQDWE